MTRRIAVIDDDPALLGLLYDLLLMEGYEPHVFLAGEGACAVLPVLEPDAVVLDLHMERADTGWRILEHLKAHPVLGRTPVLVCSADGRQLEQRAKDLRDGYGILHKPFDIDDLLGLLQRMVDRPR